MLRGLAQVRVDGRYKALRFLVWRSQYHPSIRLGVPQRVLPYRSSRSLCSASLAGGAKSAGS